ncbi:hypothetical protein Slala04_72490 [Streptomyces lavendulae subsp. lavendulae]|nr:hypothetical protein Slala04_72490 [Streptomyces lavendulae subsp. lavendulae]
MQRAAGGREAAEEKAQCGLGEVGLEAGAEVAADQSTCAAGQAQPPMR